jgi:hypothetical protein
MRTDINIPSKVYHKASPMFRECIQEHGLVPNVGESYESHWLGTDNETKLTPVIFVYDKTIQEYDSTYDDDIWEIDTKKLDESKWNKDIDEYMYEGFGSITYDAIIPIEAITLVYAGTGDSQ